MNILMVDQYGQTGGAQRCLVDLLAGWPEAGTVVVAAPADGPLLGCVRGLGFETAPISCGPYSEGDKKPVEFLRFTNDVRRQRAILRALVKEHRIDLIYANGPRVLVAAALTSAGRCPLVFHSHNRLRHTTEVALVRGALAISNGKAIACCRHVAEALPWAKTRVIENGVPDSGYWPQRRYPGQGEAWRMGIVGRISPDKGHSLLLETARRLASDGARFSITIAGASLYSAPECLEEVRSRTAGLPVRFTGWIDDIGTLFRELDLLVVPSTAEPGLPRVVLEAFSAGVPVVAVPTGGIPEAVWDGITGFLAEQPSAGALAAALRTATSCRPERLGAITQNARRQWEVNWNVERWRREVVAELRAAASREMGGATDRRQAQRA